MHPQARTSLVGATWSFSWGVKNINSEMEGNVENNVSPISEALAELVGVFTGSFSFL